MWQKRNLIQRSTCLLVSALGFLGACSHQDQPAHEEASIVRKRTIDSYSGGYQVGKAEDGSPKMVSNRRSQYDRKRRAVSQTGKDFMGQNYLTKQYHKERWGRSREVARTKEYQKKYTQEEKKAPWYVRRTAQMGREQSRWNQSHYQAKNWGSTKARENQRKAVPTPTYYDTKKTGHIQPKIRGYKEPNFSMTVEESNELLGR